MGADDEVDDDKALPASKLESSMHPPITVPQAIRASLDNLHCLL